MRSYKNICSKAAYIGATKGFDKASWAVYTYFPLALENPFVAPV
jgi:hypothetical protein